MPTDELNIVQSILQLGLSGILLFFLLILWRAYQERIKEHIEDLQRMAGMKQQQDQIGEIVDKWKQNNGVGD